MPGHTHVNLRAGNSTDPLSESTSKNNGGDPPTAHICSAEKNDQHLMIRFYQERQKDQRPN